jgi:hypothetical protein
VQSHQTSTGLSHQVILASIPYPLLPIMERGLMWLPLLGAFIWLARAGANEYQKLEAYKRWAVGFDRYKYDIYAVIGIKDRDLSWGKPTKKEPKDLQTFSLDRVKQVQLVVDNKPVELEKYANDLANLPVSGNRANLRFEFIDNSEIVNIPFTEILMAAEWAVFLQREIDIAGAGGALC